MATTVYQLLNTLTPGAVIPSADVNKISNTLEEVFVQLAELVGEGIFLSTDFNGSIVTGELSADISAGSALVGSTDSKIILLNDATVRVTGLAPSTTNYIFLQRDGSFTHNTTGSVPSNTALVCTVTTNGTEATSINNNPNGRRNLTLLADLGSTQTFSGGKTFNATITLGDAINIILNTTTGSKIGTSTSQKLAFWNATPITQPANTTDLRTLLINVGLLASGGANPLDLNGGALTAGTAKFSGAISGNATAPTLKRTSIALADADTTLTSTQYENVILEFSGTLTAGRNIVVPATAGGTWIVNNLTTGGFALTVKTAAGSGIAVAASKAAIVYSNGTNVLRATPDA